MVNKNENDPGKHLAAHSCNYIFFSMIYSASKMPSDGL